MRPRTLFGLLFYLVSLKCQKGRGYLLVGGLFLSALWVGLFWRPARERVIHRAPSLVSAGNVFGAAWLEERASGKSLIRFALLDAEGKILQERVLAEEKGAPTISFGGTHFLVAWTDGEALRAVSVSNDGKRVGGVETLARGQAYQLCQNPSWDGEEFGVVWATREKGEILLYQLLKVSEAGKPVSRPIPLSLGGSLESRCALRWDGASYFFAWSTSKALNLTRFARDGRAAKTHTLQQGPTSPLGLEALAGGFALLYEAQRRGESVLVLEQRDADLKTRFKATVSPSKYQEGSGLLAFGGERYALSRCFSGKDGGDCELATLDTEGKQKSASSYLLKAWHGGAPETALARGKGGFALLWQEPEGEVVHLYFVKASETGKIKTSTRRRVSLE